MQQLRLTQGDPGKGNGRAAQARKELRNDRRAITANGPDAGAGVRKQRRLPAERPAPQ
jgi:hypothetical protein